MQPRPSVLRQTVLYFFCLATALTLQATEPIAAPSKPEPLSLDELPLLFTGENVLAGRSGVVVRTIHAGRTRTEPVLKAEKAWEGERVYVYGSVYRDEAKGGYRMWYLGRPHLEGTEAQNRAPSLRSGGHDPVLYATSKDGVHWDKPALGLHAFDGSNQNNIVTELHSPAVLIDHLEPDPAKNYKMLGSTTKGYRAAYSADGFTWTDFPINPVLEFADTITLARDPFTKEYLAYHKRPSVVRNYSRRSVWLSRSPDFQKWTKPEMVFVPDATDDEWATQPNQRTEVYNMSVYPHAGGFVGMSTMFRVMKIYDKSELGPGQSRFDGPIDIHLVTSADGTTWTRTWPRQNVIPRGAPGSFDGGAILGLSSALVNSDTETWVYYTAITTGHGGTMPPKRLSIGRAEWRLHGFASLDAGPAGGQIETVPLQLTQGNLVVNADASRGKLRVALLEVDGQPIAGCSFEDCLPLISDELRWTVRWAKGKVPTNRPVKVVVEFLNARLFSLSSAKD